MAPTKYRRRYQRDFLRWLSANRDQFSVPPLKPIIKVGFVEMRFPGISSVLRIEVRADSIQVMVIWNDKLFDILLDLDMRPIWNGSGYYCDFCADNREIFGDLPRMRSEHLYGPFLNWCNERLLPSRWIQMVTVEGARGASLLREIGDSQNEVLPRFFTGLKTLDGRPMCAPNELVVFHLPVFEERCGGAACL